jgi:hypothetical protein
MKMKEPSFDELAEIIRKKCGLDSYESIEAGTQFERDLGVTGDDGEELLEAVGKRFGVTLTRESFNLEPNEYLFGSEASFLDLLSIFGKRPTKTLRTFTVGELLETVIKEMRKDHGTDQGA